MVHNMQVIEANQICVILKPVRQQLSLIILKKKYFYRQVLQQLGFILPTR